MLRNWVARTFAPIVLETSWVMFSVLGGASGLLLLALLPFTQYAGYEEFLTSSLGTVIMYAVQYVFALFVVLIVPFIQTAGKWAALLPQLGVTRNPSWKDALLAPIAWVGYFAASLGALILIESVFPSLSLDQQQDVGFDHISALYEYIFAFIALVILPPIAEEAIFRGYLFGRLRKLTGFWPTTIIVSTAFAVAHMQINVGIDVFVLSLFLCFLREKTGSIWSSLLLHMIKNSVAYTFLFIIKS